MKPSRKGILTAAALLTGVLTTSATVTVQGWWRFGELPDYYGDASGNSRRFNEAFSCAGGGNAGAGVTPFGCGGPLGTTGVSSTSCLYWTPLNCGTAAMWAPGNAAAGDPVYLDNGTPVAVYNPPPTNYVIECWLLPDPNPGTGKFFMSGSTDFSQPGRASGAGPGGVYFYRDAAAMTVGAFVVANAAEGVATNTPIGDLANLDPTSWMHIAVVNNGGTNTFYVNGVQHGAPQPLNTIPNGNIFAGSSEGTYNAFHGYLDELRISTFAPGAFAVTDLLTRPPGPSIVNQPQSATVWNGGAAPFTVLAAVDSSVTYQWQLNSNNISGATSATYIAPVVTLADSGGQYRCLLKSSSITVTTAVATLTVVPVMTDNVNYYRQAVNSEASLVAYFPVDGDTGTTLSNTKDPSHDGTLENGVNYDGRTNRSFGERALSFSGAGDVQVPNNPAFEFGGGNGTIEALTYLASGSSQPCTIFSWAFDGAGTSGLGYALQTSADGSQLRYINGAVVDTNNNTTSLSWSVPASLIGRLAYVALVIDHTTNVTAIVDGQSLGTKTQPGFGSAAGAPVYIGCIGSSVPVNPFNGNIDELAVYGSALPLNTLQVHYSRYLYGTNVSAPSFVSLPGPRTVIAGTAPLLSPQIVGTLPISYQWTSNGVPIPGATALTLKAISDPGTVDYVLYATNAIGWTNSQPITLTFVAAPSPYAAAVASAHPIAYWRLDEASGPTAIDSAGYHDGTYAGTVLFGAPSVITTETNTAANFAGTGSVSVPNYPELNPKGAFSLECWTRPNSGGSAQGGFIVASQNRNNSRGGYSLNGDYFFNEYEIDLGAPNSSVTRYDSTTLPQDGVPVHIVFAWDGVSPQGAIYVNGVKTTTPQGGYTGDMLNFVNNTVQVLTMGIRYDGAGPWNGVIDDVAFYDYALSDAQVTNHWSFSWVTSAITQNPADVTTNEWGTVTLTIAASGYPNTYQWYKGSTALSAATLNPDGTAKYGGVTTPTLTITETHPADSALYHAVVINALGNSTSGNANVQITPDQTPPTVVSVLALPTPNLAAGGGLYLVKVLFSERISESGATFTIPGTTINAYQVPVYAAAAPVGGDWKEAILNTSGLTPGQTYTVTVSGVKDQAQTPNTLATTNLTFKAPVLTQGTVAWDYYYLGPAPTGTTFDIGYLQSNQDYPNAPQTNWASTTFDSTPITTGDYNNVPGIGAAGDYYGDSLSGWITPTVTTNYYFFISSDDSSELDLNYNGSDPAGASPIASEPGCCNAFQEPGATQTGGPFLLTAGTPYFIRALHVEGGGGDYVKVAWRMEGDTTPAASLTPIPGTYLSSYALTPVPPAFNPVAFHNGQLSISWTGSGTLLSSPDVTLPLSQWTTVTTTSPYVVTPATGAPRMFYRVKQ